MGESVLKEQSFMPSRPAILPDPFEWVYIPGGKVELRYPMYMPGASVVIEVGSFYMAKYLITNAQFAVYVSETGQEPKHAQRWQNKSDYNQPLQPVIDLLWQEAMLFCQWLSDKAGYLITLPSDAQWQRAAQGDGDRKYPWGNDWDSSRCNTEASRIGHTTPVTQYPQGASPFEIMDMIGNVWEWCLTDAETGQNSLSLDIGENDMLEPVRIFRGSSCTTSTYSSDVWRRGATPIFFSYLTGIRLVTSGSSTLSCPLIG
jgi:formylglycine-generating enzyme required for sulfatase activity